MSRLRSLLRRASLPRGRRGRFIALLVLGGGGLLLLASAGLARLLQIHVRIDPGMILLGAAAVITSLTLFLWLERRPLADPVVTVNYDFRLVQPALPLGRYRLLLEIFYDVERGGRRERSRQARIDLQFRRQDHPEILEWCSSQIAGFLHSHERLAARRWPRAEVASGPPPTPLELRRSLSAVATTES